MEENIVTLSTATVETIFIVKDRLISIPKVSHSDIVYCSFEWALCC